MSFKLSKLINCTFKTYKINLKLLNNMSEDKNWNDLSKSEKNKTKATAAAAGILIFLTSLNSSGK